MPHFSPYTILVVFHRDWRQVNATEIEHWLDRLAYTFSPHEKYSQVECNL